MAPGLMGLSVLLIIVCLLIILTLRCNITPLRKLSLYIRLQAWAHIKTCRLSR